MQNLEGVGVMGAGWRALRSILELGRFTRVSPGLSCQRCEVIL